MPDNQLTLLENVIQLNIYSSSHNITTTFLYFLQTTFTIYKHNVIVSAYQAIEKQLKDTLNTIKGEVIQQENIVTSKNTAIQNLGRQLILIKTMSSNPQFLSVSIFKDLPKLLLQIMN